MVGGLLIHGSDTDRRRAIERTLAAGVNWIDTAPSYGDGASEQALGWLLRERPEAVQISTKVRVSPSRGDIAGQVERSLRSSLERLQRPHVELVQLHNRIMPVAGRFSVGVGDVLGPGGIADALDRVVSLGLARFRGFTAIGDTDACRKVVESGRFDTAQVYYNLLNPSAGRPVPDAWSGYDFEQLIATCHSHDLGVLCIRVLAAGVIATDERHGREGGLVPGSDVASDEKRMAAVVARLGTRYGTRAQAALRFVLAHPDVAAAIVGISDLDQLDEALAAPALGPLPEEALCALGELHEHDFGAIGAPRDPS